MATEAGVILVVEDNPQDATMTLRALKKHNISNSIVLARDGAEGVTRREPAEWRFHSLRIADFELGESE